jgi:alkylation response protein AidB-like acyl-CoA dehydrogenase
LTALGLVAACVPEGLGGLGHEVEVATAAAEELGAALHGAPYAGTVAATACLATAAARGDDRARATLDAVVDGTLVAGFGRLSPGTPSARRPTAHNVDGAGDADLLLLSDPASGEVLWLHDPATWMNLPAPHPFDTSRWCGDVEVDLAAAHRLPAEDTAPLLFGLLLAADALGATRRVLDVTVAYAKERVAFGTPIGGFQAVQHRLADHAVRVRGLSLLVSEAAHALSAGRDDGPRRVALAEAGVSGSSVAILHDLLQLTGAIGFTWEHGLHHAERRAHHDARLASNPRRARLALAEIEGWTLAG